MCFATTVPLYLCWIVKSIQKVYFEPADTANVINVQFIVLKYTFPLRCTVV